MDVVKTWDSQTPEEKLIMHEEEGKFYSEPNI